MTKCILSAAIMAVMALALSFVAHGLILYPDYSVAQGMRPPAEADTLMPFMLLAQVIFGIAFAWIYMQGRDPARPWLAQGIRYGIAVACLTALPTYLIYHVVTPVPLVLAIKQIALDSVRAVLMGIVMAWISR